MIPIIAPVVAELGIELVPIILYGGYKTVEFVHNGGDKIIKGALDVASQKDSKVKK